MAPYGIVQVFSLLACIIAGMAISLFIVPKLRFRKFPGPPISGLTFFLLGSLPTFLSDPSRFPHCFLQLARRYGHVYQVWLFHRRLVVLTLPQDARYILQTKNFPKAHSFQASFRGFLGKDSLFVSTGESHKIARKAIQDGFNARFLPAVHDAMLFEFRKLVDELDHAALLTGGVPRTFSNAVDVGQSVSSLFTRIIFRFVCGRAVESAGFSVNHSVDCCLREVMKRAAFYPFFSFLETVVTPLSWSIRKHKELLNAWLDTVIENRKSENPEDRASRSRDLLDILMASSDDVEFARANFLTFVVAGSDTSSNTLSFLLYELSLNAEILQNVRTEVVAVCGPVSEWPDGFLPDGSTIRRLQYCRQVFLETLRLHPAAATGPSRVVTEDTVLPSGARIPKDTEVLIPTYAAHRSRDVWGADADEFRPDRFASSKLKAKGGLATLGFQAFSLGKRNCIGAFLAEYAVLVVLCGLIMRYNFELACDKDDVREFHMVTMKPVTRFRDAKGDPIGLPLHISKF